MLRLYPSNLMRLVPPQGKVKTKQACILCTDDRALLRQSTTLYQQPSSTFVIPKVQIRQGMKIKINQQEKEFPEKQLLQDVITTVSGPVLRGIAVAVNGKVISRTRYALHELEEGDTVLIIKATQGG